MVGLPSSLQRIRQHHGIEHATLTLLARRVIGATLVARSDFAGFLVFGTVETAQLRAAAEEAVARMRRGERALAIHPNCGTNLAAAGILTGSAALLAGRGERRGFWGDRLPSAIVAALLALLAAAPLGQWLQAHVTTSADATGLGIADVILLREEPVMLHRVVIKPT